MYNFFCNHILLFFIIYKIHLGREEQNPYLWYENNDKFCRLRGNIRKSSWVNRTKDPELKAIISLILLAETVSNGAIITLKKLTFATALEGVDLWRGKVNTRSYAKIKTIGDLKEWLRCNLVGKLITVKRYGKNKVRVIDLLSKEEES